MIRDRQYLRLILSATVVLCACTVFGVAPTTVSSTWNSNTLEGWTSSGDATVLSQDAQLLVMFDQQSFPSSESTLAWKSYDGSFLALSLSFRMRAETRTPSELCVVLRSAYSNLEWRRYLTPPPVGQWVTYDVPVDFSAGWTLGPGTTALAFYNDKQNVEWIGIAVTRSGATEAQTILVDDFVVEGHILSDIIDPPDDTDQDGMPDAWEARYTLSATDSADALLDADGDGMSNYAEYRAGTDPTNAASIFLISAAPAQNMDAGTGIAIEWDSVRYRTYSLWKATNLVEGFTLHQGGILTTPPHNTYLDPGASTPGPSFYRIEVDPE